MGMPLARAECSSADDPGVNAHSPPRSASIRHCSSSSAAARRGRRTGGCRARHRHRPRRQRLRMGEPAGGALAAVGAASSRLLGLPAAAPGPPQPDHRRLRAAVGAGELVDETLEDIRAHGLLAPCLAVWATATSTAWCSSSRRRGRARRRRGLQPPAGAARAAHGGTSSGERGVGLRKVSYLPLEHGASTVALMRSIRRALDPHDIFGPGKVVDSVEATGAAIGPPRQGSGLAGRHLRMGVLFPNRLSIGSAATSAVALRT